MYIEQLSVFLENKIGSAAAVTGVLRDAGVNMRALALNDTSSYGVLHLILDDLQKGYDALQAAQMTVKKTPVLAVELGDSPGDLHSILSIVAQQDCNVEYAYAFLTRKTGSAVVILRIDTEREDVAKALTDAGHTIWGAHEAYDNLDINFYD